MLGKFLKWRSREKDPQLEPDSTGEHAWPHDFPTPDGFPRPDWETIYEWFYSDEALNVPRFRDTLAKWLEGIGAELGEEYHLYVNGVVHLLAPIERADALRYLKLIDRLYLELCETLPGIVDLIKENEAITFIFFDDHDDYWRYASYYHGDGVYGASGGMTILDGVVHIIIARSHSDWHEGTIAHELTHLLLSLRYLPSWVEEALAVNSENLIYGNEPQWYDPDRPSEWRWDSDTIQDFWSGKGFESPIQEQQDASYRLADMLFRAASFDYPSFQLFVAEVDPADAGNASAVKHLGLSLDEMAARILGPGNWAPDPARIEAYFKGEDNHERYLDELPDDEERPV